eukprot:g3155.t1
MLAVSKTHQALSAVVTGATIAACEVCRYWRQALGLVEDLNAVAVDPTIVTYNSLLLAMRASGSQMIKPLLQSMRLRRQNIARPNDIHMTVTHGCP